MRARVYEASIHIDVPDLRLLADNAVTDAGNAYLDGDVAAANVALGRAQLAFALCHGWGNEPEMNRALDDALGYCKSRIEGGC